MHNGKRQWTPFTCLPGSRVKLCTKTLTHTNPHKHKCTAALPGTFSRHTREIPNRKASKQLKKTTEPAIVIPSSLSTSLPQFLNSSFVLFRNSLQNPLLWLKCNRLKPSPNATQYSSSINLKPDLQRGKNYANSSFSYVLLFPDMSTILIF